MSIRVQIPPFCTCGTVLGTKSDLYYSLINEALQSGFPTQKQIERHTLGILPLTSGSPTQKHVEGYVLDILPLAHAISLVGINTYQMYFRSAQGGIYSITEDLLEMGFEPALKHLFDILTRDTQFAVKHPDGTTEVRTIQFLSPQNQRTLRQYLKDADSARWNLLNLYHHLPIVEPPRVDPLNSNISPFPPMDIPGDIPRGFLQSTYVGLVSMTNKPNRDLLLIFDGYEASESILPLIKNYEAAVTQQFDIADGIVNIINMNLLDYRDITIESIKNRNLHKIIDLAYGITNLQLRENMLTLISNYKSEFDKYQTIVNDLVLKSNNVPLHANFISQVKFQNPSFLNIRKLSGGLFAVEIQQMETSYNNLKAMVEPMKSYNNQFNENGLRPIFDKILGISPLNIIAIERLVLGINKENNFVETVKEYWRLIDEGNRIYKQLSDESDLILNTPLSIYFKMSMDNKDFQSMKFLIEGDQVMKNNVSKMINIPSIYEKIGTAKMLVENAYTSIVENLFNMVLSIRDYRTAGGGSLGMCCRTKFLAKEHISESLTLDHFYGESKTQTQTSGKGAKSKQGHAIRPFSHGENNDEMVIRKFKAW